METKKVFEETGKLGYEIKKLGNLLEKVNKKCFEMMELCPHEIVFKYNDNHSRLFMIDGTYFCPACGKLIKCYIKEHLNETAFKDSRIIPLNNLSLIGTSDVHHTIRNEVYENMDLYYDCNVSTIELSSKMEQKLIDKQCLYESPVKIKKIRKINKKTDKH